MDKALLLKLQKRKMIATTTCELLKLSGVFTDTTIRVCKFNKLNNVLDMVNYHAENHTFAGCKFISNTEENQLLAVVEYAKSLGIEPVLQEKKVIDEITIDANEEREQKPKNDNESAFDPVTILQNYLSEVAKIDKSITNYFWKAKSQGRIVNICIVPIKRELISGIISRIFIEIPFESKFVLEEFFNNPFALLGYDTKESIFCAWEGKCVREAFEERKETQFLLSERVIKTAISSCAVSRIDRYPSGYVYSFPASLLNKYLQEYILPTLISDTITAVKKSKTEPPVNIKETNDISNQSVTDTALGIKLWKQFADPNRVKDFFDSNNYRKVNCGSNNITFSLLSARLKFLRHDSESSNIFVKCRTYDEYPPLLAQCLIKWENELSFLDKPKTKKLAGLVFDFLAYVKDSQNQQNKEEINQETKESTSTEKDVPSSSTPRGKSANKGGNGSIYVKFPGGLEISPKDEINALQAVVSIAEPSIVSSLSIKIGNKLVVTRYPDKNRINHYYKLVDGWYMETCFTPFEIFQAINQLNLQCKLQLLVKFIK